MVCPPGISKKEMKKMRRISIGPWIRREGWRERDWDERRGVWFLRWNLWWWLLGILFFVCQSGISFFLFSSSTRFAHRCSGWCGGVCVCVCVCVKMSQLNLPSPSLSILPYHNITYHMSLSHSRPKIFQTKISSCLPYPPVFQDHDNAYKHIAQTRRPFKFSPVAKPSTIAKAVVPVNPSLASNGHSS